MSDDERKPHPRQKELEDLLESNRDIFSDIRRKGGRISVEEVQQGLLQFFVQWTMEKFGETEDDVRDIAIDFEIKWQQQVHERLHNTRMEMNRQKLMAGGHKPKGGIYVPGPPVTDQGVEHGKG